ncbi:hypothetical protein DVH24_019754 [Malus domestica]|uniref:Uncharacterized protein n=1 Tax=Malus domestica TaxID=3750 RepID=A0A498HZS8_MALDO|nr:hypothetical protein DVH24_019754 [Malus domestica]
MEECAACYKQYNKKNIFSSTLRALSTWFISRDVDYAHWQKHFARQFSLNKVVFYSEHKNTCCLSAPAPMVRYTMMPCTESKSNINLSNEDHVGEGLEAVALECEMVWGGSDGSLDLCARVPD